MPIETLALISWASGAASVNLFRADDIVTTESSNFGDRGYTV
jgi:hypothetical protein